MFNRKGISSLLQKLRLWLASGLAGSRSFGDAVSLFSRPPCSSASLCVWASLCLSTRPPPLVPEDDQRDTSVSYYPGMAALIKRVFSRCSSREGKHGTLTGWTCTMWLQAWGALRLGRSRLEERLGPRARRVRCGGTWEECWSQALTGPITGFGFPSEGNGNRRRVLRKDVMTHFYFERSWKVTASWGGCIHPFFLLLYLVIFSLLGLPVGNRKTCNLNTAPSRKKKR